MRLVTLYVNSDTVVQVDDSPKTWKTGKSIVLLEFGVCKSFGDDHFCGAISSDVQNIPVIKDNIDKLNNLSTDGRVAWVKNSFNKPPRIVKIKSDYIGNRLSGDDSKNISIVGSVELKWNK